MRNRGHLNIHNEQYPRVLKGRSIQVYPGGILSTINAYVRVEELVIDVMGKLEADGQRPCAGGYFY